MNPLPLVVIETDDGAEVRLRDADSGERYASLREALDSLLADEDYRPRAGILREGGEAVGVWRWLDATAEEPAPAPDGSQVTREVIATMAARLNAASPAPMDGGTSEAHQQLRETSTHADGFAHVGVEVRDRSGRWHLFLYCEIAPEVARAIDAGRLAYGSIGFTEDGRLLQHALTNVPAVEGLRPNNAIRAGGSRVFFRSMEIHRMSKPTTSKRATLSEVEPLLSEMTGASAEELGTVIVEMVAAAKAKAEHEAAEAAAEGEPAEMAYGDKKEDEESKRSVAARALLDGFQDEAAQDAFTSEVLGALRDIFGQPDAPPATALDMLKASLAAFKGALGTAAPPADAGTEDAAAMTARSALVEVPRLRSELERLRADIARRDLRDSIARKAADAHVSLTTSDADQLVADVLATTDPGARERAIERAIRLAQQVPSGDVFGRSVPPAKPEPQSFRAAWESLMPEVEKAHPGQARHVLVAIAQRTARERFPEIASA